MAEARVARDRAWLRLSVCAATSWLALAAGARAQLSEQERRGKQIYLKGDGGERGEIVARLGGDLELPAAAFPCANCHGLRGEGSSEGGLKPPPIRWHSLTTRARSALTGRERPPYDEAALERAITSGLDPGGARLHPGMPIYRMTAEQVSDLVAFLQRIGGEAELDPGLSEDAIRVGVALPMTGPLAPVGAEVKATLEAYFAEVNAQGGIYGRSFVLVAADSRGDPQGTLDATRRLVERDEVFALVASFEPGGSGAADELLRRAEVPLVGPVTLSPRRSVPPNPFVFYLLPGFSDQARVLADFVAARAAREQRGRARLAVVHARAEQEVDALEGLKAQARMHALEVVAELGYAAGAFQAPSAVAELSPRKPDYVFFFGPPDDLLAFARELAKARLDAVLVSSLLMLGRATFELPPAVAARTLLSCPAPLPWEADPSDFVALARRAKAGARHPTFQRAAYAAAEVLVEATKASGRQTSRAELVRALERLKGFRTGVLPPLTFGPNDRVGARGSYVVGIESEKGRVVRLSEWLVPKVQP